MQARIKPEQDSWGGWQVLLAGQAERKGDKKQAEDLYRKGLARLEEGDRALRAEAVLRLAAFALERKDVKGAQRHIARLKKHRIEGEFVCAPAVSRWVDPSCPATYTAARVARDMLAGKGITPGQPAVDPKRKKAFIAATIEASCYLVNNSRDKDLRQRSVDILAKHGFDEESFQELGQKLQRDPKVQNEIALGRIRCHPKK